jgi:hypothetical protein
VDDQEPDENYSQPGAFRVGETSIWSLSETDDADGVTALSPVPEIHQSRENAQDDNGLMDRLEKRASPTCTGGGGGGGDSVSVHVVISFLFLFNKKNGWSSCSRQ